MNFELRSILLSQLRALSIVLLTFACTLSPRAVADERPPNFILIFTDDQGYQDVGCFGSPDIRTPRLDAMAAHGMKFTSFYAQPICGPSRAALMTGCYPLRVAERGNIKQVHPILHGEEITVAEVLRTQGYATACFGKWDLAKHAQNGFFMDLFPTHQGFDYFFGTPTSNDAVANLYRNEELIEPKSTMATLTKRYTDEAIGFMKKNKERPFFVYLPHTMPHTRLDASEQFKGKSKRGLYGDVIEEIDFNVGRLLDAIMEMGLAENTYVLFTSDNGPWLIKNKDYANGHQPNDHGGSAGDLRSGKVSTFEGGVRVPTILWGPGSVPAGTTCDSIASTLDVMPTLAALANAELPTDRVIDGEDIRHLFHGQFQKANPKKAFFYYLRVHLQAVRQGKWKLHLPRDKEPIGAAPFSRNNHIAPSDRIGFDQPFLIDLDSDIGETTNVADRNPMVVQRLLSLVEEMRHDLGDHDRVGKNMRFFDAPDEQRPKKPPVPTRRPRPRRVKKKPNFVIIFTDDQGYADLSCFGGNHVNTPTIDRMAAEGMKLTSFYVAAPVCTPSRAALMTGCYPKRIDMAKGSNFVVLLAGDPKGLHPREITIAEVLKSAGYRTGIFGKWHLGDQPAFLPTQQGFDDSFGIPYSHDIHPFHPNQTRFMFPPLPLLDNDEVIEMDPDANHLTRRITERAVQFIKENKGHPFFLYVPHPIPHKPLHVSQRFMHDVPSEIQNKLKDEPNGTVDYRTRDKLFRQAINEIDWSVGEILGALKDQGLDDNTLVIFTSDNGPAIGSASPLRGRKGSTFEGGMREATVVRWPGRVTAGSTSNELVTAMDLLPTFAGLAGAQVPTDRVIDGRDIWPVLSASAKSPHKAFFYHKANDLKAVRSGQWKLHVNGVKPIALYNLKDDIGESQNVLRDNESVATRLLGHIEAFQKDLIANSRPAAFVDNPKPLSK